MERERTYKRKRGCLSYCLYVERGHYLYRTFPYFFDMARCDPYRKACEDDESRRIKRWHGDVSHPYQLFSVCERHLAERDAILARRG